MKCWETLQFGGTAPSKLETNGVWFCIQVLRVNHFEAPEVIKCRKSKNNDREDDINIINQWME